MGTRGKYAARPVLSLALQAAVITFHAPFSLEPDQSRQSGHPGQHPGLAGHRRGADPRAARRQDRGKFTLLAFHAVRPVHCHPRSQVVRVAQGAPQAGPSRLPAGRRSSAGGRPAYQRRLRLAPRAPGEARSPGLPCPPARGRREPTGSRRSTYEPVGRLGRGLAPAALRSAGPGRPSWRPRASPAPTASGRRRAARHWLDQGVRDRGPTVAEGHDQAVELKRGEVRGEGQAARGGRG
jgi:hypothetical protein